MKFNLRRIFLLLGMLFMVACTQPEVEPGLQDVPTVDEPTQEVMATATDVPTSTPEPTQTPVSSATPTALPTDIPTEMPTEEPTEEPEVSIDIVVEEDMPEESETGQMSELDEFADLFGMEILSEGSTLSMDAIGVSFEIPEGWSGIQMMGIMAMATSAEVDSETSIDSPTEDFDGVIVIFVPSEGATFAEMNTYTAEQLMDEMAGSRQMELENMEVLEEREPVTINDYVGLRTTIQGTDAGTPMLMEVTVLEHEGLGYMMTTIGSQEEFASEQAGITALTDTLVLSVPAEGAFEEASEEMLEDLTGMFGGGGIVTEGRLDIPAIGVSFEVPDGWTGMSLMGFLGMATNGSMDAAVESDQLDEGVVFMVTLADGEDMEEAWGNTTDEMVTSMVGSGEISDEDIEIVEDRVPVTVNGYLGERTTMEMVSEGTEVFVELTILDNDGLLYMMMYAGAASDYGAEQENYTFLVNSLELTEPDLDALGLDEFGDLGDFEEGDFSDDFSLDIEEPTLIEPLPINGTVAFDGRSEVGYQANVEIGSTYLIFLQGASDTTLHIFPQGDDPMGYIDLRSDEYELLVWEADTPAVTMAGRFYFESDQGEIKLSIFEAVDLEATKRIISVADGETLMVVGSAEADIKIDITSDVLVDSVDFGYGGNEFAVLTEPGDYEIVISQWDTDEEMGNLYLVTLPSDFELIAQSGFEFDSDVVYQSEEGELGCFWMETSSGDFNWIRVEEAFGLSEKMTQTECYQLDSCEGGEGQSGGGCYKWAESADAEAIQWDVE